jgi:RimJ/RimL family protein N-acetyltransferase
MTVARLPATTDGVVEVRPPEAGDAARLVAGRDAVFHRFLGPGADHPEPTGCVTVAGEVVGWVDVDADRAWLEPGELNAGYHVFAPFRGRGIATRAVQLLLHQLALDGHHRTVTLLIDPANDRSLALARRARFTRHGDLDGNPYWKRAVPPLTYTDGRVRIRRREPAADLDADLSAKDPEQIRWLWLPGDEGRWRSLSPAEQRAHALAGLERTAVDFGRGPKWTFSVDADGSRHVGHVDCDLANEHVPAGEANVSCSTHPDHRGRGVATGAVRQVLRFLADHTGAPRAHLIVDERNAASRAVAAAVGAVEVERWVDPFGATMVRHVREL